MDAVFHDRRVRPVELTSASFLQPSKQATEVRSAGAMWHLPLRVPWCLR